MNHITLIGTTKAPETKTTANGFDLLKFQVVTEDEYPTRDGESKTRSETHNCVAWGNLAKLRADLQPGELVSVAGRIQTRKYTGKDGQDRYFTEVVVSDVQRLRQPPLPAHTGDKLAAVVEDEFADDDIPFIRNATLYGDELYLHRRSKAPWER